MYKFALTAFLFVDLFFSSACMAFGAISTGWPLVVNGDNENLGLFGGLSYGYNQNGDLERTMLLISSAGYIAPILNSGGIAAAAVSYFQDKNCIGPEFQPTTISAPEFTPYRGMVFRALSMNDLAYIPKNAHSIRIRTQSRLVLSHGGHAECNDSADEIGAYKVVHNQSLLSR